MEALWLLAKLEKRVEYSKAVLVDNAGDIIDGAKHHYITLGNGETTTDSRGMNRYQLSAARCFLPEEGAELIPSTRSTGMCGEHCKAARRGPSRSMQEKSVAPSAQSEPDTSFRRKCRMTPGLSRVEAWAALIKCVYEACAELGRSVDPLKCPKCGGEMKIISFIEEETVIRKILRRFEVPDGGKQRDRYGSTSSPQVLWFDNWRLEYLYFSW